MTCRKNNPCFSIDWAAAGKAVRPFQQLLVRFLCLKVVSLDVSAAREHLKGSGGPPKDHRALRNCCCKRFCLRHLFSIGFVSKYGPEGGPRAAAATRQKASALASELAASVETRQWLIVLGPNPVIACLAIRFAHFTSALARFGFQRLYSGVLPTQFWNTMWVSVSLLHYLSFAELVFEREQLLSLARLSVRAREEGRSIVFLPSHLGRPET